MFVSNFEFRFWNKVAKTVSQVQFLLLKYGPQSIFFILIFFICWSVRSRYFQFFSFKNKKLVDIIYCIARCHLKSSFFNHTFHCATDDITGEVEMKLRINPVGVGKDSCWKRSKWDSCWFLSFWFNSHGWKEIRASQNTANKSHWTYLLQLYDIVNKTKSIKK